MCMEEDWNHIFTSVDALQQFHNLLQKFNNAFPIRTLKNKNEKVWLTEGIRISSENIRSQKNPE